MPGIEPSTAFSAGNITAGLQPVLDLVFHSPCEGPFLHGGFGFYMSVVDGEDPLLIHLLIYHGFAAGELYRNEGLL